jgi:hypothetical protein
MGGRCEELSKGFLGALGGPLVTLVEPRRFPQEVTAHNLDEAMECLRKNHYSLCVVLKEAREDPAVVEKCRRRAPRNSVGWRKARQREQALRVLAVSTRE